MSVCLSVCTSEAESHTHVPSPHATPQTEEYLAEARKVSRREYLKKREEKELALIEKELRDEEFLFAGE